MTDEKRTCACACCKKGILHYVIQFFVTLAAVIVAILLLAFLSHLLQQRQMTAMDMPPAAMQAQPGMPVDADSKLSPSGGSSDGE